MTTCRSSTRDAGLDRGVPRGTGGSAPRRRARRLAPAAAWPAVAWLVVAVTFAACAPAPRTEAQAQLVLRHSRMPGDRDPMPALIAEFERRHPGVTVAREPLPWTADIQHQFYVLNLEGGSAGFDVLMLDVIWVAEFARAGWLLDITDRWPPAARREHFPAVADVSMFAGRAWAVPWITNVGLLYYRRDLLARHGLAPPRTYDEIVRQALVVRDREGDRALHGFLWQGKQYEGLVVNVLESFWAAGTDVLGGDDRIFPDPEAAAAALASRRAMLATGASPPLVMGADEELTRREFGAGRAVFVRNWPYALSLFEAEGSPVRGRVGIAPLPGGGALGGAHLGVNRRTRHPDLAWALVEHLATPAAQRAIAEAVGLYPTRPALIDSPAMLEIFHAARSRPVSPWYQTISATLQPAFSAAILGLEPPERALAAARRRLEFFTRPIHGRAPPAAFGATARRP
jgi:multiple sugar transport system substrate-binding protein